MNIYQESRPPVTTAERIAALRSLSRVEKELGYVDESIAEADIPAVPFEGDRYEAEVPDTLELTDRAEFAINAFTRMLDPAMDYRFFGNAGFAWNRPFLHLGGHYSCTSKHLESLLLMRILSGSTYNIEMDKKFLKSVLHFAAKDGFFYVPWSKVALVPSYLSGGEEGGSREVVVRTKQPHVGMFEEGRMILALCMRYQHDKNPLWKELIEKKIKRLTELAVWKDDYCYFARGEYILLNDKGPIEGPMLKGSWPLYWLWGISQGCSLYCKLTGYEPALKLAGGLVKATLEHGESYDQNGRWRHYHFHTNSAALIGILEYATAVNDPALIEFVRRGYEFGKACGEPLVGFYPEIITGLSKERHDGELTCETCEVADMLVLGVKLTLAGAGEYWEDIDRCLRNQFVENQITSTDWVERIPVADRQVGHPMLCNDETDVVERTVGSFAGWAKANDAQHPMLMQCCIGNAGRSMYYVWDSILRKEADTVRVNLLLNRASPWLDVDSYLPYEGKAVLKIKQAENVAVRIPEWTDRQKLQCKVNDKECKFTWSGNYVQVKGLKSGDQMSVEFPISQRTVLREIGHAPYELTIKGNTVVDIYPEGTIYPLYQRDHYKQDRAPMKKMTRFVSNESIRW